MTHSSDSIGSHSRLLLRALDITVKADGQLSGDIPRARQAVECLLSEPVGAPLTAQLRAALHLGEHDPLNRRNRDALAVIHNRLLA